MEMFKSSKTVRTFGLAPEIRYQLFYMISMMLFHSTDYLLIDSQNKFVANLKFLVFGGVSIRILEIVLILVFISIVFQIYMKLIIQKQQCYPIQFLEAIIFPLQIFILIKSIKNKINIQSFRSDIIENVVSLIFYLTFLLTIALLIVKNTRICLRYGGPRESGIKRVQQTQFVLLSIKLLTNVVFSCWFQQQKSYQIIAISSINLLLNFNFYRTIIYEHPTIEYLCFLTQIYAWLILLVYTLFDQDEYIKMYMFNLILFFAYIYVGIMKPFKSIQDSLQNKYLKYIENFTLTKYQYSLSKQKSQGVRIEIIISLILSIFFENEKMYSKLKWSQQFTSKLVQIAQKIKSQNQNDQIQAILQTQKKLQNEQTYKTFKQLSQSAVVSGNLTSQASIFNNPVKAFVKYEQGAINHQIKKNTKQTETLIMNRNDIYDILRDHTHSSLEIGMLLCDIIWNHVLSHYKLDQYRLNSQSRRLFYFICYNFPDYSPLLTHRLFYFYYKDMTPLLEKSFLQTIQSELCYQQLRQKVKCRRQSGERNPSLGVDCEENPNKKVKIQRIFQPSKTNYYNFRYIEVIKQYNISQSIVKKLGDFHRNEVQYLQLFQNILSNKQKLLQYYQTRNFIRKQCEQLFTQYRHLRSSREMNLLFYQYIQTAYLNNNPLIAYQQFYQGLQNFFFMGKKSPYFFNRIGVTKNNKDIQRLQSMQLRQSIYNKPICIVSGIQSIGTIFQSCSDFNSLLQIDAAMETHQKGRTYTYNIHDFMLNEFKSSHQNLLSSINNIFEKPIDHEQNLKYFIVSASERFLYEIKIKVYFYLRYQKDLLIVIDFVECNRVAHLKISDQNHQPIYNYSFNDKKKKQKGLTGKQARRSRFQNVHPSLIGEYCEMIPNFSQYRQNEIKREIFSRTYYISCVKLNDQTSKQMAKINSVLSEDQSTPRGGKKRTMNKRLTNKYKKSWIKFNHYKRLQSEFIQFQEQDQLQKQIRFVQFKRNFRFKSSAGFVRILLTFIGIIVFSFLLYAFFMNQEKKLQKIVYQIQNKQYVDQMFLLTQSRWKSQVKMIRLLNTMMQNQNQTQTQQLQYLLDDVNSATQEIQGQISGNQQILQNLLGHDLIVNYVFNFKCNGQSQKCFQPYHSSQMLKIKADWLLFSQVMQNPFDLQANAMSQSSINQFYDNSSGNNNSDSSLKSQINQIQKDFIKNIQKQRFIQFLVYSIISFLFTISLIFTIFHIKISVVGYYSYAVNTSLSFRMNFLKQQRILKDIINNLQLNLEDNLYDQVLSDITQSKGIQEYMVFDHLSQSRLNQQCQAAYYDFKRQELEMKKQKYQHRPFIHLTIWQFFIEAFVHPIVRFLSFITALFIIYHLNSLKMETVKSFINGVTEIQQISQNIIDLSYLTLYSRDITQQYSSNQEFLQIYNAKITQIDKVNKVQVMQKIFPLSDQMVGQILNGKDLCLNLQLKKCLTKVKGYVHNPYFQTVARLLNTQKMLLKHLQQFQTPGFVLSDIEYGHFQGLFRQNFYRSYGAIKTAQSIAEIGTLSLNAYIILEYEVIIEVLVFLVTVVLIFQFYVQSKNLNMTLIIFNQEFMKIAPLSQLKEQEGYKYFIHLQSTLRKQIS